jgi:hypothetical protein
MNYAESSDGNFEIGINYTDLKGSNMYGAFDLGFRDYKYNLPYVRHGSDNSEDICNFPITLSVTGTPKQ